MTYREFYKEIAYWEFGGAFNEPYRITTSYTPEQKEVMRLIEQLEQSQKKRFDNFRYRYLPKILTFSEPVTTAVMTENTRFVNENRYYLGELEKAEKKYPDYDVYIGYYTSMHRAIFYTEDWRSLGQFGIPKKGVIVPQDGDIEIVYKPPIRQRRSDSKYHDLEVLGSFADPDKPNDKTAKKFFYGRKR